MAIKSLSIRIDSEMLDKLHVVADYEGRSANGQILVLIRDELSADQMAHYIEPMQHTIPTPFGRAANIANISYNCIVYGALLGDPVPIVDGRNCLAYELRLST